MTTTKVATRQAKIDWLLTHQDLWQGFPRGEQHTDLRQKSIVDEMKRAGLISKSTYYPDVNLYNLIVDAREQRRKKGEHGQPRTQSSGEDLRQVHEDGQA